MARRQCDDCKANMGPYEPRTRVGDRMLCDACKDSPRGGLVSATPKVATSGDGDGMRKHAHDSGDGMSVFHCPFVGAGRY